MCFSCILSIMTFSGPICHIIEVINVHKSWDPPWDLGSCSKYKIDWKKNMNHDHQMLA